jgi:hypothetical protein
MTDACAIEQSQNDSPIPQHLLAHPALERPYHFTIPPELLDEAAGVLDMSRIDKNVLSADRELSLLVGDHRSAAGFENEHFIQYQRLCSQPPVDQGLNPESLIAEMGWDINPSKLRGAFDEMKGQLAREERNVRAYCGWLMTNRLFVQEQIDLYQATRNALPGGLIPRLIDHPRSLPKRDNLTHDDAAVAIEQWRSFYRRWRLRYMAAPGLPVPLEAQIAPGVPDFTPSHLTTEVITVRLPFNHPIPSQDELREDISKANGTSVPKHLREWAKIVTASNTGKRTLDRFARLFELQHFYRIINERYGDALYLRGECLKKAFGAYLCVERATVHSDLVLIRKRLGTDWVSTTLK